jgi:hypothetical protein
MCANAGARDTGGRPFLVLNGVQTQSARVQNLLPYVDEAVALGANVLRLSPQAEGMEEIVAAFAGEGALAPVNACDGYWHGRAGMERLAGQA